MWRVRWRGDPGTVPGPPAIQGGAVEAVRGGGRGGWLMPEPAPAATLWRVEAGFAGCGGDTDSDRPGCGGGVTVVAATAAAAAAADGVQYACSWRTLQTPICFFCASWKWVATKAMHPPHPPHQSQQKVKKMNLLVHGFAMNLKASYVHGLVQKDDQPACELSRPAWKRRLSALMHSQAQHDPPTHRKFCHRCNPTRKKRGVILGMGSGVPWSRSSPAMPKLPA
mmetsp:Transcript_50063/g.99489  ORF Transcript_50063/g.99489 Transcript_50063/m.99489 type:complete len:224 (-) Transcript_50063:49-720(-)